MRKLVMSLSVLGGLLFAGTLPASANAAAGLTAVHIDKADRARTKTGWRVADGAIAAGAAAGDTAAGGWGHRGWGTRLERRRHWCWRHPVWGHRLGGITPRYRYNGGYYPYYGSRYYYGGRSLVRLVAAGTAVAAGVHRWAIGVDTVGWGGGGVGPSCAGVAVMAVTSS